MKNIKINTLWKRDEKNKNRIIEGDFSKAEFNNIKNWQFTEKVDGMNIRILFSDGNVYIGGRTDDAQIPAHLFNMLVTKFTNELMRATFPPKEGMSDYPKIELFGEGYGPKIQKGGGLYRDDPGFILFDVWVDGWWLERKSVEEIATKMGLDVVPLLPGSTMEDGINIVKSMPKSLISKQEKISEGIVARSHPLVLFRDGAPVMWKLKVKDYTDLAK